MQDVLLGIIKYTKYSEALNILFFLFKKYIFEVSQTGSVLNISALSKKINKVYIEQEYLANINLQMPKFSNKWSLIKELTHTQSVHINTE